MWDLPGVNGIDYTARRITHGSLAQSTEGGRPELTLEADRAEDTPLALLCPPALSQPLYVEVKCGSYANLEGALMTLFSGMVVDVEATGRRLRARCATWLDVRGTVPAFQFQRRCNYRVFEPNTCRVLRTAYEKPGTISAISDRTVTVTGAALAGIAANWFAEGWLETGTGTATERRTILASTAASGNAITLTLNAALRTAIVGQALTLFPGCDGTETACLAKFNNFTNFGGHRFALRNLTFKALETPAVGGGKK
jgi:uncharacterized phage protein (TIGR02218 family)